MIHLTKKPFAILLLVISFSTFAIPPKNSSMNCPDRCAQHEEECCTTEGGSIYFGIPYF